MTQFLTLIFIAIIVEGLITYIKTFFVGGKLQWQMFVGILLGIIVALVYNVDIFALFDIKTRVPYVGAILTGVLISRGSNYIFDLIKSLQSIGVSTTLSAVSDVKSGVINVEQITADQKGAPVYRC